MTTSDDGGDVEAPPTPAAGPSTTTRNRGSSTGGNSSIMASPPPAVSIHSPPPLELMNAVLGYGRRPLGSPTLGSEQEGGDDDEELGRSTSFAHQHHHHRPRRSLGGSGSHSHSHGNGDGQGPPTPTRSSIARSLSHLSWELVRALSATEGLSFCQICREYETISATFRLSACGHRFCRECVASYLTCKINEGQTQPVCFFIAEQDAVLRQQHSARIPHPCGTPVAEEDIKELVAPPAFAKYLRFKLNKENKHARACPFCDSLELGDPAQPLMACGACGKEFCYFHSSAHLGTSCVEYEQLMREENLKNQALISAIAKPCPQCQSPCEKAGGCNQMRCVSCGAHFCWLCGRQVDTGTFPSHFQWWNMKGCPNMQMQESTEAPPASHMRLMRILSAVQVVVLGPAALALGLAFYVAFLPCFLLQWCQTRRTEELQTQFTGCVSFWGNALLALCAAPFLLLLLLLVFLVTFLQALLCSAFSRFGCCCPAAPAMAPTPSAAAASPAGAGAGAAAAGQRRESRSLSASCGPSSMFPPAPASGLEAIAMVANAFGANNAAAGQQQQQQQQQPHAQQEGSIANGLGLGSGVKGGAGAASPTMTAPPLQEIRVQEA